MCVYVWIIAAVLHLHHIHSTSCYSFFIPLLTVGALLLPASQNCMNEIDVSCHALNLSTRCAHVGFSHSLAPKVIARPRATAAVYMIRLECYSRSSSSKENLGVSSSDTNFNCAVDTPLDHDKIDPSNSFQRFRWELGNHSAPAMLRLAWCKNFSNVVDLFEPARGIHCQQILKANSWCQQILSAIQQIYLP